MIESLTLWGLNRIHKKPFISPVLLRKIQTGAVPVVSEELP